MLQLQTILPDTLELLKWLSAQPELQGMRLVGGTSLALQYGHRQSVNLDFFGHLAVEQEEILAMIERAGSCTIRNRTKNRTHFYSSYILPKKVAIQPFLP